MMSGLITILLMSTLLGLGSFAVGILPLFFNFSKSHLAKLSTLGTGLLLGAALGVIIPEGIEALSNTTAHLPTSKIALSLLTGFTFMLLIEQFTSHNGGHSHSRVNSLPYITLNSNPAEDGEEMDRTSGWRLEKAFPVTLGLVVHGLADGLALGVSALGDTESDLSLVVFLALLIHKAPTALALTTTLLSTSLSRPECKKHIAFFSLSTPLGALISFLVLSALEAGDDKESDWTGVALLVSGGTFLYVATVLQPVSPKADSGSEPSKATRITLLIIGMFLPFAIGAVFGHEHKHGHWKEEQSAHRIPRH